jgi:toluene monooxygenase system ferredoxin subunit
MAKLDVIKESYVFQSLSTEELQKLASISREEICASGQYVFREGDQARSLYIVEEGKVELQMRVSFSSEHRTASVATVDVITKGATFGWSAIAKPHLFTGSAQAANTCKLIVIDGSKLLELMDSDHTMGYEVMKRFSEVVTARLVLTRQILLSERGLALLSQAHNY